MTLNVLDPATGAERLRQDLGADPGSEEGLCGLLRAEVHARGSALRAVTLERVARRIEAVVAVDPERLADLCGALVREGDLVRGPGGVLWATPLRAVPLLNGSARLFSSAPSAALTAVLGVAPRARGATRAVPWRAGMDASIAATGGRVLSPDVWAGLEHAPLADDFYLARLDERLTWEAEAPASLERDGPLEWRGWVPDGEQPGWRREAPTAKLWWARTSWGHRRAWTAGQGSPTRAPFLELRRDDADRARFALSRQAGASPAVVVQPAVDHAIVEIPAFLPRPEYRWVSLQCEYAGDSVQVGRWRVPADAAREVTDMLARRLGLAVETR